MKKIKVLLIAFCVLSSGIISAQTENQQEYKIILKRPVVSS